jgi:hypothetical protein
MFKKNFSFLVYQPIKNSIFSIDKANISQLFPLDDFFRIALLSRKIGRSKCLFSNNREKKPMEKGYGFGLCRRKKIISSKINLNLVGGNVFDLQNEFHDNRT